jgi:hypothetical protein
MPLPKGIPPSVSSVVPLNGDPDLQGIEHIHQIRDLRFKTPYIVPVFHHHEVSPCVAGMEQRHIQPQVLVLMLELELELGRSLLGGQFLRPKTRISFPSLPVMNTVR